MNRMMRGICWVLGTIFLMSGSVGRAQTTMPAGMSNQEMQQRMQDLQSQLDELKARMNAAPAANQPNGGNSGANGANSGAGNGASSGENRGNGGSGQNATGGTPTVAAPPTNNEFPLTAGYSTQSGFHIQSADGNFFLHPWAFLQVRDTYNYRSITAGGVHDSEDGLELPRAKFIMDGNIFSRDLTFQLIWSTSDTTGNLGLQDGWGRYHIPNTIFSVEAGNIRDPADHESIIFATRSLTPERSIVNNIFLNGDNIVKAAMLSAGYDQEGWLRGEVAFTGGERNFDTTFQNYPTNPANWGAAGRVEYKAMGDWRDYVQFTSLDDKQPLLVFGLGADYTEAGATAALTHIGDVQYNMPNGLMFYAGYLGRYVRHNDNTPATNGTPTVASLTYPSIDSYDATVRVMAAYLIDKHFEPFVRYEYIHMDPRELAPIVNNHDLNDITAGFNYYFYGHRAKFTLGATYLPDGSPFSSSIGDLLTTHRGEEFILQSQVQLIF